MMRAAAAEPTAAKRLLPFGLRFPRRATISGHARLLARPAYQKLLAAEPLLRKLIPVLIFIFLVIVGLARFVELYQLRTEREYQARETMGMIASALAGSLDKLQSGAASPPSRLDVLNVLADALPPGATGDGRRIYVTDQAGTVIATAPRAVDEEDIPLTRIIGEAQPLTTFGARAGVLEIALADGSRALATVANLDRASGSVAVVEPLANVFDNWRADVSLNVSIFIGTSAILLVILYAYFAQSTRAVEADRIYTETQARFETALMRGRCGLWDWDLARGRMFWSRSMFEILGLEPRDALLGFGEVSRLIHPDDGDLMALAEFALRGGRGDRRPACSACAMPTDAGSGSVPAPSWSTGSRASRI